ncbi:MAG: exosortase/archaeosortase family protein [Planctomycetes bacterium]|nr:exosortase/archaeosortase family protein [Planctomycetota bacterium]
MAETSRSSLMPAVPGAVALLAGAFAWSYWPVLAHLWREWMNNEDYSVGVLVPPVALVIILLRWSRLRQCRVEPCWWGLVLIALGLAARAFGLLFIYESAERYSIVLVVAGLVLLAAGRQVTRSLGWVLAFLLLMVPLPGVAHNLVSAPLQTIATRGAVFGLEMIAVSATREGNTIMLGGSVPMGIAEACNGLRMLTAFVVVAAAMAFLIPRPPWKRVFLVLSCVPIAVACNLVRLVITGVLFLHLSSEAAEKFFHNFAGWVMMPCAVFLLMGELWLLDRLADDGETPSQTEAATHARPAQRASAGAR